MWEWFAEDKRRRDVGLRRLRNSIAATVHEAEAQNTSANTAAEPVVPPYIPTKSSPFFLLVSVKIIGSFVQKFCEKEGG